MSSSGDGDKPAQTGLVDMGDISFYNTPHNPSLQHFRDRAYPGSLQRDRAERHLGAIAAHRGRPARHLGHRQRDLPRSMPTMPRTARTSASSSGSGAATRRPIGPRTSTARPSRSPARPRSIRTSTPPRRSVASGPPTTSMPGRASRTQLAATLRQQPCHPRHFPDGGRRRHRRTLRAPESTRLYRAAGR